MMIVKFTDSDHKFSRELEREEKLGNKILPANSIKSVGRTL